MQNLHLKKMVLGVSIGLVGIYSAYIYEVNTVTLFVIALGVSVIIVSVRDRLRGVLTAVIGMYLVFISITYVEIGLPVKILCATIGVASLIRGTQIQIKEFIEILT